MMRQVLGESLNVASVLTWGPCYYHQKQFFTGHDDPLSRPGRLMHYDLEVSGFPSSHAGHLVLLGLNCLRTTRRPGLLALFQAAGIAADKVSVHTIGYVIAPRAGHISGGAYAWDTSAALADTPLHLFLPIATLEKLRGD